MKKKRGLCLDPVANFHISNGAELYHINYSADFSKKRMDQSYGMMVNYMYSNGDKQGLDELLKQNSANYIIHQKIPVSENVQKILQNY